jgi:hypothetical protein
MTKLSSPIFIMSSERSGSNLLRVLIGNHSNIASPVTVQLLNTVAACSRFYAPLSDKENARALFNEIVKIVNHEYHAWNLHPDFERFYKSGVNSFLDFFNFFYAEQMKKEGKKERIVFKENCIFNYAFELRSYYPDAKFIYLYRDPRDYVASWMKVPLGYESPEKAIKVWATEQLKCDQVINVFGLPCYSLKYEDLIENTPKCMSEVLAFIGEPVEEACFSTDADKNKTVTWNEYWKNLDKPVIKDNSGKFKELFDEETVRILEFHSKEFMLKLGYKPLYDFRLMPARKTTVFRSLLTNMSKKDAIKTQASNDKTSTLLKERHSLSQQMNANAQDHFEKQIKKQS